MSPQVRRCGGPARGHPDPGLAHQPALLRLLLQLAHRRGQHRGPQPGRAHRQTVHGGGGLQPQVQRIPARGAREVRTAHRVKVVNEIHYYSSFLTAGSRPRMTWCPACGRGSARRCRRTGTATAARPATTRTTAATRRPQLPRRRRSCVPSWSVPAAATQGVRVELRPGWS